MILLAATADATATGWWAILPPLVAIAMALLLREVVVALFVAVFSGAMLVVGGNPITAMARTIDTYILEALADRDHASILIFSALLGGMVGVIGKSGGASGVVERLAPLATTRTRGQLATYFTGLMVFFDDYANTLIVGPTMRPITDGLRISREKLAYIVDSTAAPIVSLVPISTWIGFEIGLVQDAFQQISLDRDAFSTIVASIPFRSYQWIALALGLGIAASGRDFGAMFRAEKRALETGDLVAPGQVPLADFGRDEMEPPEGKPRRAINAVLPIVAVVVVTVVGLWRSGAAAATRTAEMSGLDWAREVLSNGNSLNALLWASLAGVLTAMTLATTQRILSLERATHAAIQGIKATLMAFIVLILAWALGAVCADLDTAGYLVRLTEGLLAPQAIPVITFLLAAAIAFATGTSWGTMTILTPLAIPLANSLLIGAGSGPETGAYSSVLLGTIAAVLAGSVWGDHCSPISDTTILSSMASGCDHLAHVKTQLPYALLVGTTAAMIGFLPSAYGVPAWITVLVGISLVLGVLFLRGRNPAEPEST